MLFCLFQQLFQQERGILVACHALRYFVCVGHISAKLYLKTIVVETFWLLISKT